MTEHASSSSLTPADLDRLAEQYEAAAAWVAASDAYLHDPLMAAHHAWMAARERWFAVADPGAASIACARSAANNLALLALAREGLEAGKSVALSVQMAEENERALHVIVGTWRARAEAAEAEVERPRKSHPRHLPRGDGPMSLESPEPTDPVSEAVAAHAAYIAAGRQKVRAVRALTESQSKEMTSRIKQLREEGADV